MNATGLSQTNRFETLDLLIASIFMLLSEERSSKAEVYRSEAACCQARKVTADA